MNDDAPARLERLIAIGTALPEVQVTGEPQKRFTVRGKSFAWYLVNHHHDGRIAVSCKIPLGDRELLLNADKDRFYLPAYLGHDGWIGVRLDLPTVDWGEVAGLLRTSYTHFAPKKLLALLK